MIRFYSKEEPILSNVPTTSFDNGITMTATPRRFNPERLKNDIDGHVRTW